jgi:hypothetical protein
MQKTPFKQPEIIWLLYGHGDRLKGCLRHLFHLQVTIQRILVHTGVVFFARNINAELLYRYFVNEQWNIITGVQYINDQIEDNPDQNTPANEYTIMDPFCLYWF